MSRSKPSGLMEQFRQGAINLKAGASWVLKEIFKEPAYVPPPPKEPEPVYRRHVD